MRAVSFRTFALAALASLAMATSSSAVTILQFGQFNPNDVVTATASGSSTTLSTSSSVSPFSIPVLITNIGGTQLGTPIAAFETFQNVVSTGTVTTDGNRVQQLYSGTIAITSGAATAQFPAGTGGNFLTATFQNATLGGFLTGNAAALVGSRPPQNVTFSSNFAAIMPLIAGDPPENLSLTFVSLLPSLTVSGTTIGSFTATNTGEFGTAPTAVIPEPSGIVMASMAMIGSLGCFGWRCRKASQA